MAETNGRHQEPNHTSEVLNFPEVKGKLVDYVEVFSDSEYYAITIRFQDETALTFTLETAVYAFPVLSDWAGGNETILQKYKVIRSRVQRT